MSVAEDKDLTVTENLMIINVRFWIVDAGRASVAGSEIVGIGGDSGVIVISDGNSANATIALISLDGELNGRSIACPCGTIDGAGIWRESITIIFIAGSKDNLGHRCAGESNG